MERNHKRLYMKLKQFEKLGFKVNLINDDTIYVWQESRGENMPPFVEVRKGMLTFRTWICLTNDYGMHEPYVERILGICEGFII